MRLSQEASRLVQILYGRDACMVALPIWERELAHLTNSMEARGVIESFAITDGVRNALFGMTNQAIRLERKEG